MRVIAGTARGVELRSPRGGRTRPTTGRLRESLFSMLEAADADFSEVMDLYAGSGALGIEALSRGAEHCTFVEADARAASVVRENLRRTKLVERGTVVTGRVGRWRPEDGRERTLILADPPYDDPAPWDAIVATVQGALADASIIVVEHAARTEPPRSLAGRVLWRDRRQGDGAVAIYRSEGEESA